MPITVNILAKPSSGGLLDASALRYRERVDSIKRYLPRIATDIRLTMDGDLGRKYDVVLVVLGMEGLDQHLPETLNQISNMGTITLIDARPPFNFYIADAILTSEREWVTDHPCDGRFVFPLISGIDQDLAQGLKWCSPGRDRIGVIDPSGKAVIPQDIPKIKIETCFPTGGTIPWPCPGTGLEAFLDLDAVVVVSDGDIASARARMRLLQALGMPVLFVETRVLLRPVLASLTDPEVLSREAIRSRVVAGWNDAVTAARHYAHLIRILVSRDIKWKRNA